MSLLARGEAEAFLTPLMSRSTVFLLDSKETDLLFSRFLLNCLASTKNGGSIADINAFYSSNAERVAPRSDAPSVIIHLPPPTFVVEPWIIDFLIRADEAVVILDDLNTIYHLLSFDSSKRVGNRMSFLMGLASFLARTRRQTIISKVHVLKRPILNRRGARSLDRLGDMGVSAESRADELTFRSRSGMGWRDGVFSVRVG